MNYKVIGIGEVLWDLLPSGPQLGGAPANFAYHAHALGAETEIITRVGDDSSGREIVRRISEMGLSVAGVQLDTSAPTSTVSVTLVGDGIPEYRIHENVAWDRIAVNAEAQGLVQTADAVCFGSLAQRSVVSRQSIQRLVAATPAAAWRVFDINLRQNYYDRETIEHSLNLANVLKLNDSELPALARLFNLGGHRHQQVENLARQFELRAVALTCGAEGSWLFRDGTWSTQAAVPVTVMDTVGAGDAFTAAFCVGLLHESDLDQINAIANQVAAFVCSCRGAMPSLPAHLRTAYLPTTSPLKL